MVGNYRTETKSQTRLRPHYKNYQKAFVRSFESFITSCIPKGPNQIWIYISQRSDGFHQTQKVGSRVMLKFGMP